MKKSFLFKTLVIGASLLTASSAFAASTINMDGSVTLDATDPFSFTMNYNGFNTQSQTPLAGLTSSILFNFLGTSGGGSTYDFSYTLTNTSSSPVTASRVSVMGFDTNPNITGATASGLFNIVSNGNTPNVGALEVCLKDGGGGGCAGGGNGGVTIGNSGNGLFSLSFSGAPTSINMNNFAVRYQSIEGLGQVSSASGVGTPYIPTVPEPATWAMMLAGFGFVGGLMRRRRTTTVLA
jgi:hypothetical protein